MKTVWKMFHLTFQGEEKTDLLLESLHYSQLFVVYGNSGFSMS